MDFPPFSFVHKSIDSFCLAARKRLRQWTKPDNHALALNAAMDLTRSNQELVLESMLLCQQLIVLRR
jgi:hypothetical protein